MNDMKYELAKELEEAGFPQHKINMGLANWLHGDDGPMYAPTLEELIEACGSELRYLFQDNEGNWEAAQGPLVGKQFLRHYSIACATPTEAVARLWIALNAGTPAPKE